jgi:hypothetical protein
MLASKSPRLKASSIARTASTFSSDIARAVSREDRCCSAASDRYGRLMPGYEGEAAGLRGAFLEAKREASEERGGAAAPAAGSATSVVSP